MLCTFWVRGDNLNERVESIGDNRGEKGEGMGVNIDGFDKVKGRGDMG